MKINFLKSGKEFSVSRERFDFNSWLDQDYCLTAVEKDGYALKYVKDQTEAICLAAVEKDGYALKYVDITKSFIAPSKIKPCRRNCP